MLNLFSNTGFRYFVGAILFFLAGAFIQHKAVKKAEDSLALITRAEKELDQLAVQAEDNLELLLANPISQIRSLSDKGLFFLLFENDSMLLWSDHRLAFDIKPGQFKPNAVSKFRNGWFLVVSETRGSKTALGLVLLKNAYSYQNRFLQNDFHPALGFPNKAEIYSHPEPESFAVRLKSGTPVFWVALPLPGGKDTPGPVSLMFYLIGFLLLARSIHLTGRLVANLKLKMWAAPIFGISLVGLRFFSGYFQFPSFLYDEPLFNPKYFASSGILHSLGDLLLNAVLAFYLCSWLYRRFSAHANGFWKKLKLNRNFLQVLLTLFFNACSYLVFRLIRSLVVNSSISFNVNDLFSLDSFSLYSFIAIGILLFSLILLGDAFVLHARRTGQSPPKFFLTSLSGSLIFMASCLISFPDYPEDLADTYGPVFSLAILLIFYSLRRSGQGPLVFSQMIPVLALMALITGLNFFSFNREKEHKTRAHLAVKLLNQRDHIGEHMFSEIESKIVLDSVVNNLFDTLSEMPVDKGIRHLHEGYFNGYWSKYETRLHTYNEAGKSTFSSNNENVVLEYFLETRIRKGVETFSRNLTFLGNEGGKTAYLAIIPFYSKSRGGIVRGTLVVEMESKPVESESGFPELLLSSEVAGAARFLPADYAFAFYREGNLQYRFGKFPYYSKSALFEEGKHLFVDADGFSHYCYRPTADMLVVVSRPQEGAADFLNLASYLFAFFSIFLVIFSMTRTLPITLTLAGIAALTFGARIQRMMLLIVSLSLLITGTVTAWYIIREFDRNQYEKIRAKTSSLLLAVQNLFGNAPALTREGLRNYPYDLLNIAVSSGVDYNLYDIHGKILFSTQPKIYEQGLLSERMDARANHALLRQGRSAYLQDEHIGSFLFAVSYEAIRSPDNTLLGYLGLHSFSKESELRRNISAFFVTFINVYVFLFALALLLSFALSERIVRPLRMIRQKIGATRFGGKNEPLDWNASDEIGELVMDYNRMVRELEASAEKLARSERESAWREMARQVAHEIKNPLTPMKLSIQHLQRAWNEKSPDMDSMIKRIGETIIRQIDTLAAIAGEFSNFAQLPKPQTEKINLDQIIRSCIQLFQGREGVKIEYIEENPGTEMLVLGDQDHITRIFTNLIRNGLEAIPEETGGTITIQVKEAEGRKLVTVSDTGTGIPPEVREKIFSPNFTTKSSGTGLGLAMVKSMMETSGGSIWFETEEGKGTVFFLDFPSGNT